MGQLHRFISQVLGIPGFKVAVWFWLRADGVALLDHNDLFVPPDAALVVRLKRIGRPFCPDCGHRCRKTHEALDCRKWRDLSWGTHHVFVQYAPQRVKCPRCNATPVEWLPWADTHRRETIRLQQVVALDAASMPVSNVAAKYGLSWDTIKGIELQALARWARTRDTPTLRMVGIDEKYLGRRGAWHCFVKDALHSHSLSYSHFFQRTSQYFVSISVFTVVHCAVCVHRRVIHKIPKGSFRWHRFGL